MRRQPVCRLRTHHSLFPASTPASLFHSVREPLLLVDSRRVLRAVNAPACDLRERFAQLSERVRQVLDLILDGLPNKLIAREIGLSTRTVESHRSRIYIKPGANSLAQRVRSVMKLEEPAARELTL